MAPAASIKASSTPRAARRADAAFLAAAGAAAFLLRLFMIPADAIINGDGVYYARLGRQLADGNLAGGISAYWSPLYPLLIGIASFFFDDLEFAGRFVSVVAGALVVVPAFLLVRNFYGRAAAVLATILLVAHPALVASSGWVMTEALYALVFTTAVLAGATALRRARAGCFFVVGLLLGAAYLLKPEAIGFVGLFGALAVGAKLVFRRLPARRLAAGYLLLLVGFGLYFAPYVLFLHQKTGRWTISQKLLSNTVVDFDRGLLSLTDDRETTMRDRLFGDVYAPAPKAAPAAPAPAAAPPAATTSAGRFNLEGLAVKTISHLRKQLREHVPAVMPPVFLLLALAGFFFRRRKLRRAARDVYLFSFVACTLLGYALTVIELRYSFALVPILLGWTAAGAVGIGRFAARAIDRFRRSERPLDARWPLAALLAVLLLSLGPLYRSYFQPAVIGNAPFEEKAAGLWLKDHAAPDSLLMSSGAIPAFYAGTRHLYLPDEKLADVLEYARRKGVRYLLVNDRRLRNTPKAFPGAAAPELPAEYRLVYRSEEHPGYRVFIFELPQ